ncbi:hypothetical protein Efla_000701 [Eimeria flavescens]
MKNWRISGSIRLPTIAWYLAVTGPIGATHPENIVTAYVEPVAGRPDGGAPASLRIKPEYGGPTPWVYRGPDITEPPENVQPLENAGLAARTLINTAAGISAFLSGLAVNEGKELFQTGDLNVHFKFKEQSVHVSLSSGNRCVEHASDGWRQTAHMHDDACCRHNNDVHVRFSFASPSRWKPLHVRCISLLMQKELTPDRFADCLCCTCMREAFISRAFHRQRWQAGSIVTAVTDLPVASDINDVKSGGFGHVNGITSAS